MMTLTRRIASLERRVPQAPQRRPVPNDPAEFARGFLTGEFSTEDIDPHHPDHTGWLTRLFAFLITIRHDQEMCPLGVSNEPDPSHLARADWQTLDDYMRRG
jgi:hypothetical protein